MAQDFLKVLQGKLRFDSKQLAYCTHYSWFGVVKNDRLGIEQLHLFYNRKPALLSPGLLTISVQGSSGLRELQKKRSDSPLRIEETDGEGFSGTIAFVDSDILCYHAVLVEKSDASAVRATFSLPETELRFRRRAIYDTKRRLLKLETLVPRTDPRDPDPDHPLTLCLIIPEAFGKLSATWGGKQVVTSGEDLKIETDGPLTFTFSAGRDDLLQSEQTFVLGIGEGPTADKIEARIARIGTIDSNSSLAASTNWLARALDKFSFDGIPAGLRVPYAKAVYQILSNTKSPRGRIQGYAVFPSRGTYCSHYLWDACFTNLGIAQFNQRLAEDSLLTLCENQEVDGKIPQFISATWNRPGESQPPLIAWSAWLLYERFGNKRLIRNIYGPICRMVNWWFECRDEDGDGVVEYQDPLESGWDDSPRFDKGRIAAVDLNAYLNREMRLLAKMAAVMGIPGDASMWEQRATEHGKRMYERLFDREDGVFYDRIVREDRLWKVLTPASFSPLWTGVAVSENAARKMIVKYLIDPKRFFGARPFPVVAYNDPHYDPEKWWRGPVWPNIAWSMVEVLKAHGFEKERKEAVARLVEMMAGGDELNELYNSSTGRPLGAPGLCWTCAVFMDLVRESGKQ